MIKKKAIIILLSTMIIISSLAFSEITVSAAVADGWSKNVTTGQWCYYKNSTLVKITWVQDSSKRWFYLGSDGVMATDKWSQDSSKRWFYLGKDGAMVINAWSQDSSKRWFYLGGDGAMVINTWSQDSSKRWFYLGADGAMVTSQWIHWNGKQYYFDSDGSMAVSTTIDGWVVGDDGSWNGQPQATSTNNKKGYVYNPELQIDLKVRSAPTLNSTILGYLYNYEKFDIIDTTVDTSGNVWDKISYNNSFAYISNAYVQVYTSPPDNVVNIAKNITKQFEVGNANQVAGNFDGQGLSLGYLQWCIGQGTFQPLLNRMNREYSSEMESIFGTINYTAIQSMLLDTPANQLTWANGINDSTNKIIEPWNSQFVSLCNNKDFINIEADSEVYMVKQAMLICDKYNIKTVRGFALAFDIVVQNGSINSDATKNINTALAQNPSMTEKNLLGVIANAVADGLGNNSGDIRLREMSIVNGQGTVHGAVLNLDTSYGLSDNNWR